MNVDFLMKNYQGNIYLVTVNSKNTRKRSKICLKLTIKIPEPRKGRLI